MLNKIRENKEFLQILCLTLLTTTAFFTLSILMETLSIYFTLGFNVVWIDNFVSTFLNVIFWLLKGYTLYCGFACLLLFYLMIRFRKSFNHS